MLIIHYSLFIINYTLLITKIPRHFPTPGDFYFKKIPLLLSWQIECLGHLCHLFLAHAIRLKSHALGIDVNLGTL